MAIKSRFGSDAEIAAKYLLPQKLYDLFDQAPKIGEVHEYRAFMAIIQNSLERRAEYEGRDFSVYPAWARHVHSPKTHVIVTGHVLICHVSPYDEFYHQRSGRLFTEDPRTRAGQISRLVNSTTRRVNA